MSSYEINISLLVDSIYKNEVFIGWLVRLFVFSLLFHITVSVVDFHQKVFLKNRKYEFSDLRIKDVAVFFFNGKQTVTITAIFLFFIWSWVVAAGVVVGRGDGDAPWKIALVLISITALVAIEVLLRKWQRSIEKETDGIGGTDPSDGEEEKASPPFFKRHFPFFAQLVFDAVMSALTGFIDLVKRQIERTDAVASRIETCATQLGDAERTNAAQQRESTENFKKLDDQVRKTRSMLDLLMRKVDRMEDLLSNTSPIGGAGQNNRKNASFGRTSKRTPYRQKPQHAVQRKG